MTSILNSALGMLLAGALASGAPAPAAGDPTPSPGPAPVRHARVAPVGGETTSAAWRAKHSLYFKRNWGVEILGVRRVASGMMLRFDYRVVDPDKASALTDRKSRPFLIDEKTRTALAVPAMENIGELRQVAPLEQDRTYYVIFGNPGGLVKRGGKVTLMVGNFKAEGMVVD